MPRRKQRQWGVRRPEELSSGSWRAWTRRADGKKGPSKTFGPSEYAEAAAWMAREQDILDGKLPAEMSQVPGTVAATRPVLFADYIVTYAASSGGAWGTRDSRKSAAKQLAKAWPTIAVADIKPADVRRLLVEMEDAGLSAGTRGNRLTALRGCMQQAITDGIRGDDPTQRFVVAGRRNTRANRVPTDDEVERLIAHMPYYASPAVLLSRDSGLRLGEVAALRWGALDLTGDYNGGIPAVQVGPILLRNNTIQPHPKGKEIHWVPLSSRTVAKLLDLLERHPSEPHEFVFRETGDAQPRRGGSFAPTTYRYGGEMINYQRWDWLWRKARKAAGWRYPLPRWHDLRHALGHDLHAREAPAQVIQAVLRHADLATSRRYMPDVDLRMAAKWTNPNPTPRLTVVRDDQAATG